MALKKKKKIKKAAVKPKGKKKPKAKKKGGPVIVYLGLGSNVGDREEFIEQALFLLGKNPGIMVTKHSSNYETDPEGGGDQPKFLNAAVEIRTKLAPLKLLEICQEIETALGRERELEWGPRTIDIDILLYGDQIVSEENLQPLFIKVWNLLIDFGKYKFIAIPREKNREADRLVNEALDAKQENLF